MYRKIVVLLLLSLIVLAGCSRGDEAGGTRAKELTAGEIAGAFAGQGLKLIQTDLRPESVFQRERNGRAPMVFLLKNEEISVYQFPAAEGREAGWDDFEEHTQTADPVPYKAYQEKSMLIFYVQDSGQAVEQELNAKISRAIAAMLSLAHQDA